MSETNTEALALEAKNARNLKELIVTPYAADRMSKLLPASITPERMASVAITAMTKTPKLLQCTPESFMSCMMSCSELGLEPDNRRAYLIPYKNVCTLLIGYQGLIELILNDDNIMSIQAEVIHENDEVIISKGKVKEHQYSFTAERGPVVGAYAEIERVNGGVQCVVMRLDEIEQIRNASQGYRSAKQYGKSHPWMTNFGEMAKKTAVRRLAKYLKLTPEARKHIATMDENDGHEFRNVTPTQQAQPREEAVNPESMLESMPEINFEPEPKEGE